MRRRLASERWRGQCCNFEAASHERRDAQGNLQHLVFRRGQERSRYKSKEVRVYGASSMHTKIQGWSGERLLTSVPIRRFA
jgi:hypothetical protein